MAGRRALARVPVTHDNSPCRRVFIGPRYATRFARRVPGMTKIRGRRRYFLRALISAFVHCGARTRDTDAAPPFLLARDRGLSSEVQSDRDSDWFDRTAWSERPSRHRCIVPGGYCE